MHLFCVNWHNLKCSIANQSLYILVFTLQLLYCLLHLPPPTVNAYYIVTASLRSTMNYTPFSVLSYSSNIKTQDGLLNRIIIMIIIILQAKVYASNHNDSSHNYFAFSISSLCHLEFLSNLAPNLVYHLCRQFIRLPMAYWNHSNHHSFWSQHTPHTQAKQ